ncbi:hypothetical protein R3P38DRAFT_3421430 [Favolaschia claudopus]|uniref:Uncharacterized protein n=1 Tax=Favolaschia claudopus TaxID=2862362 RepID=A0AAW0D6I5_9AGAR
MSAVPRRGAFAAMTIDPYASLAHVEAPSHLRDELCSQVESQTYVVYISDVSPDLYEHGERGGKPQSRFHRRPHQPPAYRDVTVEFLLHGLPPTSPALSIDSGMSIPIFPALHHPHHREPLQPSHLLPFRNCYLAPFVAARVRVAAGAASPAGHGATYCLSKPEQLRHDTWFETDRRRREEALVHRASIARGADAHVDGEVPPTPTSPGAMSTRPQRGSYMPLYGAQAAARWSDSETMRLSAEEEEEREEKEDVGVNGGLYRNAGGAEGGVRHSGLSVVFSYDFAGVGELRSPVEFFEEGERMGWIAQSLRYQSAISGDDGESSHDTRTVVDSLKAPRLLAKLVAAGKSTVRRLLLPSSADRDTLSEKPQKMPMRGRASAYL